MFFFVGIPKILYRFIHSFAERHSGRGINLLGSRIPSVTSKNDKCEIPDCRLNVVRDTGRHSKNVHDE